MELIAIPKSEEPHPWMEVARKASLLSPVTRFQLGAVLVKKGRVLAAAPNHRKAHPKFGSGRFQCLHAEGTVIYQALLAGHDVAGASLWIYRTNQNPSRPCLDCQTLIANHNIKRVYFYA